MEQGRIEHGFYVQGDLKFAVGSNKNTPHEAFDAVDALSHADKVKLAKLNGIQTEPYIVNPLKKVLKSIVQNAWFAATRGNVPTELIDFHKGVLATYAAEINTPSVGFLSKKTRAASKTRPVLLFTIDEAKYEADQKEWMGQRYLVVKSMIEIGANGSTGKSVRDIFENVKGTRETNAPSRNAVGQIVNKLVEAKIATLLNPQDVRQRGTKATPAPKAATPAKKKH